MDGYMKMDVLEDIVTNVRPKNDFITEASTEVKVIAGEVIKWEEINSKSEGTNEFAGMQKMYAHNHELLTRNQRLKQKDRIETRIQVGAAAEDDTHFRSKQNEMMSRLPLFVDLTNESATEDCGVNQTYQDQLFECDICQSTYTRKTNMLRHRRRHATDPTRSHHDYRSGLARPGQEVFACDICGKKFTWKENMLWHRREHTTDPVRPHHDDRTGPSRPGQQFYACDICGKTFTWRDNMLWHRREHTTDPARPHHDNRTVPARHGQQVFACDICGKTFTWRENMLWHRREHTTDPARSLPDNRRRPTRSEQELFACEIWKTFAYRQNMLRPRRRHTTNPVRPHDGDGRVRPIESSQYNYLRQPTCNVMLKGHEQLVTKENRVNNKTIQIDEAEVQYTPMVQNFVSKPVMISPRKLDFAVKAEVEVCVSADTQKGWVVTNDAHVQRNSVELDNQSVTDGGEVPASRSDPPLLKRGRAYYDVDEITDCWKCDMKFTSRSALQSHMKTHRTQLPFRCYLCQASYNSRLESLSHLAEKHELDWINLKEKYNIANVIAFAMQVDTAVEKRCNALKATLTTMGDEDSPVEFFDDYLQRKIYCSLCPMRFRSNMQHLRRHMCSHTGKREFNCDICLKSFTAKFHLERHRKIHTDYPARTSDWNESVMSGDHVDENTSEKRQNGNSSSDSIADVEMSSSSSEADFLEVETLTTEHQTSDLVEPIVDGSDNYVTALEKMDGYSEMNMPVDVEKGADQGKINVKDDDLETEKNGIVRLEESNICLNAAASVENHVGPRIEGQKEQNGARTGSLSSSAGTITYDSANITIRHLKEPAQIITYKNKENNEKGTECSKCDHIFASSVELARHRQIHRTDLPYRCYLCDATYNKRSACLEHISEIHTSDWLVLKEKYGLTDLEKFSEKMDKRVETFCEKLSAGSVSEITKEDLKEFNMRTIPLDYKWRKIYCCLCPLKFWSLSELQRHMCFHTGERRFKCDVCLESFFCESNLKRHKKNLADTHFLDMRKELPGDTEHLSDFEGIHDKENMSPETEDTDFENQQNRPVENLPSVEDSSSNGSDSIPNCYGENFGQTDKKTDSESHCHLVPNSQDENLEQTGKEAQQTVREINSKEISSQDNAKSSQVDTSRLCHLCGKTYLNLSALQCHMSDVHKKRHFCHICNKVFAKRYEVLRHMHVHNGVKPFSCITCGKQFVSESYLRKHEYEHSGGQGALKCKFCDIKFLSSEKLNSHMKLRHRFNEFQCSVCERSFISRSGLTKHELTHTGKGAYNCDICGRNYGTLSVIKRHMLYHFKDLIGILYKVYTCDTCGRKFKSKSVFDRHVRSHTAEKVCICDICGLLLASVPGLKSHLKTHLAPVERKKTAIEYECNICHKKFAKDSSMSMHKRIHRNDKRYSCEICGKKFTQSYSLTVHMRVHTRSKPFECEVCGQRYTQSYPLTVHKRKKHPVLPSDDSQG